MRVSVTLPSLERLLFAIPQLSISQRKALLTACRVQSYPHSGSRLRERLKDDWESVVILDFDSTPPRERVGRAPVSMTLLSLITSPTDYFQSPILSGFISSVVRSAPIMDVDPYIETRTTLISKEIMASINEYRPVKLDYTSIFSNSYQDRHIPLAPNLAANPAVAQEIYRAFESVRASLKNRILYPKCGNKTVGQAVQSEFWKCVPSRFVPDVQEEIEKFGGVTTQVLQKMEFWEGIRVRGPVEVRSSWKYSDLKPRIYFAQGGDTFHVSKYVQPVFNILVDSLDVTHRMNRFFEPLSDLSKKDLVIIYDYTSFTSTIQEIVEFIEQLANFMRGTKVFLIGEKDQLETWDLGELLCSYNQTCNIDALFDISKVAKFSEEVDFTLRHTCGMLGVPGNIQSCTLLHGIHLAFVAGSLYKCKCIGDDAKLYTRFLSPLDRVIFESQLRNIGQISIEKTEEFEYEDEDDYELHAWHYAKRPILRIFNRVLSHYLSVFPTLDCILGLRDTNRTVLPGALTLNSRRTKFSNIWLRLLRILSIEGGDITEEDRQFLFNYQRRAFHELEVIRYPAGFHKDGESSFLVPPFFRPEEFGMDPSVIVVSDFLYEEEVETLVPGSFIQWPCGFVGETFSSGSTPLLTFMTKMGILERKVDVETISRKLVGDEEFGKRLLGYYKPQSTYRLLRLPPVWMYAMML
jgi:flavodoxin